MHPGGPPPALRAGLQPHSARVEAGLWAAGLVCQPRAQVCAEVPRPRVGVGTQLTPAAAWSAGRGQCGWDGAVLVSGHSPPPQCPTSEVKAPDTALGYGYHGGYSQTVHPCSAATWGLVGGGRPRGEGACEEEEEGTLQGEVLAIHAGG